MIATLRKLTMLFVATMLAACASMPPPSPERQSSYSFADTHDTPLAGYVRNHTNGHPGKSGVLLLETGLEAFLARVVLAQDAARSIDVQYFMFHDDETANFLLAKLVEAADRGVRVRILVDDMGMSDLDLDLMALDAHPNIEMRIFNPFNRDTCRLLQALTQFGSVTRRMHNKSFTVDNQVTIVGGRNIGDHYFDADDAFSFGDLDAIAIGPVVEQVSEQFDLYWNYQLAYPVGEIIDVEVDEGVEAWMRKELDAYVSEMQASPYAKAAINSSLAEKIQKSAETYHWGDVKAVYDLPQKLDEPTHRTDLHLSQKVRPTFKAVKSELIIISPYFVPGSEGVQFFRNLEESGVQVRILTNSLASTDVTIVHAGYAKYRAALLRAGVELYEVDKTVTTKQLNAKKEEKEGSRKASLHAKTYLFDREKLFVGTMNFDFRSVIQNTEVGLVISAPELASTVAQRFDAIVAEKVFRVEFFENAFGEEQMRWVKGDEVFYNEPHVGFWKSLGVGLLGIFPIDSQL